MTTVLQTQAGERTTKMRDYLSFSQINTYRSCPLRYYFCYIEQIPEETEETLVVIDFKTSRSKWSSLQAEQSAEQLLLYAELARDLLPDKPLRLEFVVATKTKTPSIDRHEVDFDEARIARTRKMVERVWSGIESELFYPAPSPMNCGGCPFREPCRNWTG